MNEESILTETTANGDNSIVPKENSSIIAFRLRIVKTIALYFSFIYMGMSFTVLGPTLVHLELLFCTSTAAVSSVSIGHGISWVLGAFVCGVIYDGLNAEFMFACSSCIMIAAVSLAPFTGSVYGFHVLIAIVGLTGAYLDTGGQSYTVNLWEGHRFREPSLQCAHMLWSLGSALGPIIANPFLVPLHRDDSNETQCIGLESASLFVTTTESTALLSTTLESVQPHVAYATVNLTNTSAPLFGVDFNHTQECLRPEGVEDVRYVYIAIAFAGIISTILYFVAFFKTVPMKIRLDCQKKALTDEKVKSTPKDASLKFRIVVLALLFAFLFFDTINEIVMGFFLTPFVIKGFCWPVNKATMLSTVFWAIHGLGRVLAVPISMFLKPLTMIAINLSLTTLGFVLMVICAHTDISYLWVTAGLAGFGMSSMYPSTILWTADTVPLTGRAAAVISTAAALGSMISPAFTGKLFDDVGPMSFVYVLAGSCFLQCIMFIFLVIVSRCCKSARCLSSPTRQLDVNGTSGTGDSGLPAEVTPLTDNAQRDVEADDFAVKETPS